MSLTINMQGVSTPYLRHYIGPWFMDMDEADALLNQIEQTDLVLHIQAIEKQKGGEPGEANPPRQRYVYDLDAASGLASIEVSGALMKVESSMTDGMSSVMLSRTFKEMARNPSVKGVMVKMDSPGGTASGTDELAHAMSSLSAVKPTAVYVGGMMASAAYWVGSQADHISASEVSDVGSIGTYVVVKDYSEVADKSGVKIHVVKSGEFKGMGEPGTKITDKMLAELQRRVDDKQAVFSAAVMQGRGIDKATIEKWADGRAHVAAKAKELGMIDAVETYDQALARLSERINNVTSRPIGRIGARMGAATTNDVVQTAAVVDAAKVNEPAKVNDIVASIVADTKSSADRIAEIKASCPGASADFVLSQVERNASITTAQQNYISILGEKMTALTDSLNAKNTEIGTLKTQVSTLETQVASQRANAVNTPASQTAAGAGEIVTTSTDPKDIAKAEWAANKDKCQEHYPDEKRYAAFRAVEIRGGLRD